MTLSQIRLEVQNRAGDDTLSSSSIDLWVNLGIKQWAARGDWPSIIDIDSTQTTTASTIEYDLPSDFKKMISVRIEASASSGETDATEYSFVRYMNKNVDTTGNYYYLNPTNSKVGIIPTPQTTGLTIFQKYFHIPADIAAGTESPPFPENYHELVVFFALKKYFEQNDELEKSVYYHREFENMIEQMKIDLTIRSSGQLARMRDIRELTVDNQGQMINSVELGQ